MYVAQGGNPALGSDVAPFDLLLHSPADIEVLSQPSWWTLRRLLVIVGVLVCALALLGLWITQLHRQVEERTAELATQIHSRQRVEHQRAMEQERARIAQDLHDELGSGITEISMLATVAGSASAPGNGQGGHLEEIGDRARQMVTALDEIVWAMNPKHDSLMSLVSYSCLYADRLLKLANITCQLKGAVDLPDRPVSSVQRHEFFLAFKEAITNVIRHSGATEVRLGVRLIGNRLRLSIADNGRGLAADARARGGDGLVNMRARLEKMGGRFAIASQRGRGTTVRFYVPLNWKFMIRVAIVEDSKTIRESLTHFVQTDPECQCVFACATAEEALAGIPKHQPEVVLMDIQLPKLSGIDCTAQLKKMLPAVQIIMVTVYEDTERISAALRAGACGYLLKRCTPAELVSAVREARMGGVPMPREIARKVIASFQAAVHGRGRN